MRAALDTLRTETERQSGFHLQVAQQIKQDLEGQTLAFLAKQQQHRKGYQAAIEKTFKTKQTQESYVLRAREKYESDCSKINSFTAQATLAQGKELDKLNFKRERAEQTVRANEKDFQRFARELKETVTRWEGEWKTFCDSCQDLEEERLEFMKDNMWAYANAVSTVCVADDEVCLNVSMLFCNLLNTLRHSRARNCDSHLNKSSPKRTWRTLCASMEQAMLCKTPLPLSTMQIRMRYLLPPSGLPPVLHGSSELRIDNVSR